MLMIYSPRNIFPVGLKYSIQNRFIRERGAGIHLAPLRSVAGQQRVVEIGVTLDAIARDAAALLDVAEQLHQRRQLRVGKRVEPVPVVDELDADGLTAVV